MYIGITTFKERFDSHFKTLLNDIKGTPAIISVNASYKNGLCNEYRKQMLNLLFLHDDNVSPIFYQQMRGCAKMWNDLIIHSPTEHILICNDDIRIIDCEKLINNCKEMSKQHDFFTINNCMSHFVVSKKFAIKMGWFDERFLGFGHEDGDMIWRHFKMFNKTFPNYFDDSIIDKSSNIIDTGIKTSMGKYTYFNELFIQQKYIPDENGLQCTFDQKRSLHLENITQYPYEDFFNKNKNLL
jgi:hypothetical protein